MRRFRNPRYAPEFLERKLCPSGFAGNPGVAALYSTPDPAASQNNPPAPNSASADITDTTSIPNTVYYAATSVADAAISGPASSDPALNATTDTDPALNDVSTTDDGSDPDPDPDPDPDNPDPSDDPGRPPFVPLPPAPIGPEAEAF
jgi:hypothetical protein